MQDTMINQNTNTKKNRMGRASYTAWLGILCIGTILNVLLLLMPQFSPFNTLTQNLIFSAFLALFFT